MSTNKMHVQYMARHTDNYNSISLTINTCGDGFSNYDSIIHNRTAYYNNSNFKTQEIDIVETKY